jgi:hypothetical protein
MPAGSRHSRWGPWWGVWGSTLTRGGLGGGVPGARYTSPFALAGGRIRAATSCASAQLQHLTGQDHRRLVLFGLK